MTRNGGQCRQYLGKIISLSNFYPGCIPGSVPVAQVDTFKHPEEGERGTWKHEVSHQDRNEAPSEFGGDEDDDQWNGCRCQDVRVIVVVPHGTADRH